MQPSFLGKKFFLLLHHVRIRYAAIYGANRGTLGLFVKASAFRTLSRNNIIKLRGHRPLRGLRVYGRPIF
jgi:hypothetical protein